MTAPLSIGSHVEIIGPGRFCKASPIGNRFQIEETEKHGPVIEYSAFNIHDWYPASSLRLVEELKIGDLVEITGDPVGIWCDEDKGHVCEIVDIKENRNIRLRGKLFTYPTKSLRKLSPSEIEEHLKSELKIGDWVESNGIPKRIFQIESMLTSDWSKRTYCKCAGYEFYIEDLRKLTPGEIQQNQAIETVPGIRGKYANIDGRLSAIESRLDKLGSSHSELLGDVEALAEKISDIQKTQQNQWDRINRHGNKIHAIKEKQEEQQNRMDQIASDRTQLLDLLVSRLNRIDKMQGDQKARMDAIVKRHGDHWDEQDGQLEALDALCVSLECRQDKQQKAIDFLEAYQRGEMPEVCDMPLSKIGSLAAMSMFGPLPACIASAIKHEAEEAEKRKQKGTCDEEDCQPFPEKINVSIWVGEEAHTNESTCPGDLLAWCEKVLDSMREG